MKKNEFKINQFQYKKVKYSYKTFIDCWTLFSKLFLNKIDKTKNFVKN